jgi:GNAT superfamily N-acetyltransferase
MMARHEFIVASTSTHRDELIQLNVEYLDWVFNGIQEHFGIPANEVVGMPAAEYVPTVIDKVCGDPPPRGVFYLLEVDGGLAGMGGLRFISPGVAEIKRIYVRPQYRGMQLGELMLQRLLSDATRFGYRRLCLDSGPFMKSAQRLYEGAGFADCSPYEGTEVPADFRDRWRFMQRNLSPQQRGTHS